MSAVHGDLNDAELTMKKPKWLFGERWLQSRRIGRFLLLSLLTVVLISGWMPFGWGQMPIPPPSAQSLEQAPAQVRRFGTLEVAPVQFQGNVLFEVVAPTVKNRKEAGALTPVEERAEQITANLNRVIAIDPTIGTPWTPQQIKAYYTNFDPASLKVSIVTSTEATTIVATDRYRPQPLQLVTVTALDADYHGTTVSMLAARWQGAISQALSQELSQLTPTAFFGQVRKALLIALLMIAMSGLIWLLSRYLQHQDTALQLKQAAEIKEAQRDSDTATPDISFEDLLVWRRNRFFAALRKEFSLKRQQNLISFLQWLSNWLQVVVWLGGIAIILYEFPQTQQLAVQVLKAPLLFLIICFAVGLVNRIGDLVIDRFAKTWEEMIFMDVDDTQRTTLRMSTIINVLKGFKTFVIWFFGITWALGAIGVPVGSVLAGGAIVALAISLGFQSLIKDLINGCLILWEDQYAIGDVVQIGSISGLVENMNLRITQLRNGEGRLITIPNSAIVQVENLTRTWSRVDCTIEVAYETDVRRSLTLLRQIAQQMYDEPEWRQWILEPPEILGVDTLSHTGIVLRVWIKTQPLKQWLVGREFRLRVRLAFDANEIAINKSPQPIIAEDDPTLNEGVLPDADQGVGNLTHPSQPIPAQKLSKSAVLALEQRPQQPSQTNAGEPET